MGDLRSVSKEFITEFIEMYRNFPCLWKIKSKEYGDRELKRLAYEILAKKLSEVIPRCSKETVVKKIDSLRGNFRKEYRKVKTAEKSGVNYVPTLWYYEKLIFLKSQNQEFTPTIEEVEAAQEEENEEEECFPEFIIKSELVEYDPIDSIVNLFNEPISIQSTSSTNPAAPTTIKTRSTSQKRRLHENHDNDAQKRKINTDDERYARPDVEDEFNVVGKNFAYKLRALPKSVRIFTEKLMTDILFEAELGNINRNTTITINNKK